MSRTPSDICLPRWCRISTPSTISVDGRSKGRRRATCQLTAPGRASNRLGTDPKVGCQTWASRNSHAPSSNMLLSLLVRLVCPVLLKTVSILCSQQLSVVGCLQATAPLRWPCMAPRPFSCPGTQFWRQAWWKPANPRRPRPKTATTEPRCTSSAACQLSCPSPIKRRHPASRSPARLLPQHASVILDLSPWPRSGVAIAHADSGRTTPERSGRPRRRCRRELAGDG